MLVLGTGQREIVKHQDDYAVLTVLQSRWLHFKLEVMTELQKNCL